MDGLFVEFELWHWLALGAVSVLLLLPGMIFLGKATAYALQDTDRPRPRKRQVRQETKVDLLLRLRER